MHSLIQKGYGLLGNWKLKKMLAHKQPANPSINRTVESGVPLRSTPLSTAA
jgi:hypothetical protein